MTMFGSELKMLKCAVERDKQIVDTQYIKFFFCNLLFFFLNCAVLTVNQNVTKDKLRSIYHNGRTKY